MREFNARIFKPAIMIRPAAVLFLLLASAHFCGAQRLSVSTNAAEWANLGTINAEAGVAVGRHFSIHTGVRVNPWTFREGVPEDRVDDPYGEGEVQFQNRKQSYDLSVRFWPWYIYSGWWFGFKGQYQEYDRGGLVRGMLREAGDAFGAGLSAGYTYMLGSHWNLEAGVGVWGGYKTYGTFRCTNCGKPVESGRKAFILPDELKISVMYIF